ncbi:MAG: hypothetical protein EA422_14470 [Gemmatimonadales bacterium]|nr:MAG: hypothetical protein EA422_14470 [Gemmatimonadales bacterium]
MDTTTSEAGAMAEGTRITLGRISADLLVAGTPAAGALLRRRMDRLAREALPERLARRLDETLQGWDGIVRIGELEVELDARMEDLPGGALAEGWARAVATALERELSRGPSANLVRFDSAGGYLAAYVVERLSGRRRPPWVFADFAPLGHLSPEDAATELLSARPGHLQTLARALGREMRAETFARRLGEGRARRLLEAAAGPVSPSAADPDRLARLVGDGPPPDAPPSVAALTLLMEWWRRAEPADREAEAGAALLLAGALDELEGADSPGEAGETPAGEGASRDRAGRSSGTPCLDRLRRTSQGRGVLAHLLGREPAPLPPSPEPNGGGELPDSPPAVDPSRPDAPETASPHQAPLDRAPAPLRALRTAFAGLALALPVIRALDLHLHLDPAQIRVLLRSLLDDDSGPLLRAEGLLPVLVPDTAGTAVGVDEAPAPAVPWPSLADTLLVGLDPDRKEGIRGALESSGPAHAYALLVAGHLAQRLYGLTRSSPSYLRAQFLERSGWVQSTETELHVHLDSLPLAVVLRMSGQLGDRGALPWAGDRRLRITVGEE